MTTEAEAAARSNLWALAVRTCRVYELRTSRDGCCGAQGHSLPPQYEVYIVWKEDRLQMRIASDPDPVAAVAAAWRCMCPDV
jgi:hypothetical protein